MSNPDVADFVILHTIQIKFESPSPSNIKIDEVGFIYIA
jgi:hypothetical protein